MHILRPCPRPTESETSGDSTQKSVFEQAFLVIVIHAEYTTVQERMIAYYKFSKDLRLFLTLGQENPAVFIVCLVDENVTLCFENINILE